MSSYYRAKKREAGPPARELRDVVLKGKVMEVREGEKGRKVYGARKIWLELNSQGIAVARCSRRFLGFCGLTSITARPIKARAAAGSTSGTP